MFEKPERGGGLDDTDPLLQPIEGVDFDTWVRVQADLIRQKVPRRNYDEVAQLRGVPAGRWSDIESAWRNRMQGNPGLAQRFSARRTRQRSRPDTAFLLTTYATEQGPSA